MFARLQRQGVTVPWVGFVDADYRDSQRNIVHISQAGLSIAREYYLGADSRSIQQRDYLQAAMGELLALAGYADAAAMATDVITLETQLARIQSSNVDNRDVERTYNITTQSQLVTDTPELFTGLQLAALGIAADYPVNVMQPDYLRQLRQVFHRTDIADWRKYLAARVVLHYAELLSDDFTAVTSAYDIKRGLYEVRPPHWQLAIAYLNDNVGMLLGRLYVDAYFDDGIKADVTAIKDAIKEEYRLAISASDRLGSETRRSALHKLDKMAFQIGYPDQWQDYSPLQIDSRDLVGNHRRIAEYEHQRNIDKLGRAVDRTEWAVPPQEVNAFYNPGTNTFVLLAGILTEPFYSKEDDLAANYGGIGFVIGHEIGHGFDDQGSRFDADGNLANWWSNSDAASFNALARQLIEQANAYEIFPGHTLNGELEIGEIIGDLSGAEIALGAFEKQLRQRDVDDHEAEIQRFLAQIAITWRSKIRREVMLNLLQADPHPPAEYRANGTLRNLDAYHEVYHTQPADAMYLAPEKRVNLW
jgi:predicted metalloendopeptidase